MPRPCVNRGGAQSLIRLAEVPQLEVEVALSGSALAALDCWQARPGEVLSLVDPQGQHYRARLVAREAGSAWVVPFERLARPAESPLAIHVYQALPDKERFELVLQKLTELGVQRIVPFCSSRSSTLQQRDAGQKKSHRWPEVLLRAARQCRRAMLPELAPVLDWSEALQEAARADLALLLYEKEASWPLAEALTAERPQVVALLIGPEGGFTPQEVAAARQAGVLPVGLGTRVLRTETAAIVAASLVQFALGDLGQD